jgi:hypothetical protein
MRARLIKPGFFKSDELAALPPLGRILFAGLWCMADREGRLNDRPRIIKAEVLPYDDCDCNALLDALAQEGFLVRYQTGGRPFLQLTTFLKHQQPHYKEPPSVIPPPPGHIDSQVVTFGVGAEQRARILARDRNACVRCGSHHDLTIDHIAPRSRGGGGDDENLQTLCRRCNSAKNNRLASADHDPTLTQPRTDQSAPWPPVPDPDPVPDPETVLPPLPPTPAPVKTDARAPEEKAPLRRFPKPAEIERDQVESHPLFEPLVALFGRPPTIKLPEWQPYIAALDEMGARPEDIPRAGAQYIRIMGTDGTGRPIRRTLKALVEHWYDCLAPVELAAMPRAPGDHRAPINGQLDEAKYTGDGPYARFFNRPYEDDEVTEAMTEPTGATL